MSKTYQLWRCSKVDGCEKPCQNISMFQFPCFICAKDVFRSVCCGENLLELANKRETTIFVSCFGFQVTSMSVFVSVLVNLLDKNKRETAMFLFHVSVMFQCFRRRQPNQMPKHESEVVLFHFSFSVAMHARTDTHMPANNRSCEVVTGFTRSVLCAFLLVLWEVCRCFGRAFTHSKFLWKWLILKQSAS